MPSASGQPEWEPATSHHWEPVLRGLRAEALDCLQTTIALIADRTHGTGAHTALACRWRFPSRGRGGSVGAQPTLEDRLDDAAELLGLRFREPRGPLTAAQVRQLVDGEDIFVVADSYDLPWLPYAGQQHMPHGFLLASAGTGYTVVDAYHNDTEWGPSRPGVWSLSPDGLARALRNGVITVAVRAAGPRPSLHPSRVLADNAERARAAAAAIEQYAANLRARADRVEVIEAMVLDIWLLGRERALFACWLGDRPGAAEVAARAQEWQNLASVSYLTLRRVRRGQAASTGVIDGMVDLLYADAELVAGLADRPVVAENAVREAVLDALRESLSIDDATIRGAGSLRALPGFDSFRLVEIVERVERRLGTPVLEVSVNDLRDVDGLCRLFVPAANGTLESPR